MCIRDSLEVAQSPRARRSRELPSLPGRLLVQLHDAVRAVEEEVAEDRLEQTAVEGDPGEGGLAVAEVLHHRRRLVEGARDEVGVVAVDRVEVLAVEDAQDLGVLGEGPEVGDEPLLVVLCARERRGSEGARASDLGVSV